MAIIANCHRDPKEQPEPFTAKDFMRTESGRRPRRKNVRIPAGAIAAYFEGLAARGIVSKEPV